jgi:hypothetical protein
MRKLLLALCGLAVLSTAPAYAVPPDACIRHNDIWNWSSVNDKTLILEDFRHHKFLLKLLGTCGNFKFHQSLIIKSRGALGISCVEPGDNVITHDVGFRGVCSVLSIAPYTPGMEKKPDADNKPTDKPTDKPADKPSSY